MKGKQLTASSCCVGAVNGNPEGEAKARDPYDDANGDDEGEAKARDPYDDVTDDADKGFNDE
eukprot:5188685-Prorocentrum_lima.AAC.1